MLNKFRGFLTSPWYQAIPFLIGVAGIVGGEKAVLPSMIINALLVALILFLSDDMLPALLPAFCVISLGVTLLETLDTVIPYIPFGVPAAVGLVFHLIFYRKPIFIGESLYGLLAASAAILLSGIGAPLETRDYQSGGAIYHIIGLSVGLVLLYFVFASNRREHRSYDPIDYFLLSMLLLGLLSAVIVLANIGQWFFSNLALDEADRQWSTKILIHSFMYRNTIATLLIMCLPSAFYFAKRTENKIMQIVYFLLGAFLYLSMLLTTARTALLFGTLLFIICIVYYLCDKKAWGIKCVNLLICLVGAGAILFIFKDPLQALLDVPTIKEVFTSQEARVKFLLRSFDDFLTHPLFGIGITSTVNRDLYKGGIGCICWYHMYFPQLWGSMGILGICAYTFQSVIRAVLVFTKPNSQSIALGLSYLGLFLYSQTDPGEFAPIPYAVLTVAIFVLLEGRLRKYKRAVTISD